MNHIDIIFDDLILNTTNATRGPINFKDLDFKSISYLLECNYISLNAWEKMSEIDKIFLALNIFTDNNPSGISKQEALHIYKMDPYSKPANKIKFIVQESQGYEKEVTFDKKRSVYENFIVRVKSLHAQFGVQCDDIIGFSKKTNILTREIASNFKKIEAIMDRLNLLLKAISEGPMNYKLMETIKSIKTISNLEDIQKLKNEMDMNPHFNNDNLDQTYTQKDFITINLIKSTINEKYYELSNQSVVETKVELPEENIELEGQVKLLGDENKELEGQVKLLGDENKELEGKYKLLGDENKELEGKYKLLGDENKELEGKYKAWEKMNKENRFLKTVIVVGLVSVGVGGAVYLYNNLLLED